MDNKTREKIAEQIIEMTNNLNKVMDEIGGYGFSLNRMKNTTLFEFICHVAAPNEIRFAHIKKASKDD